MKYLFIIAAAFVVAVGCTTMDAEKGDLITAAREDHTEMVKSLLSAGADVNVSYKYGRPPLMAAAREGHTAPRRANKE